MDWADAGRVLRGPVLSKFYTCLCLGLCQAIRRINLLRYGILMKKSGFITCFSQALFALCLLLISQSALALGSSAFTHLVFNGVPATSGSGVGQLARWANAGSVNGAPVDVELEITAITAGSSVVFETAGNDARVRFNAGGAASPEVSIAYRFYLNATSTPVTLLPHLIFRALQQSGNETLVFSTADVAAYSVETPTSINVVNNSGSLTLTAIADGSGRENNAEIDFQPAASFAVVYRVDAGEHSFEVDGNFDLEPISPTITKFDTTAPATPTVNSQVTSSATPTLSGSAEALSYLSVIAGGATYFRLADNAGAWSVDTATATPDGGVFAPDVNGANNVLVISTDSAGNSASDVTVDELVIDTTLPVVSINAPGIVNSLNAAAYTLSGNCTVGDGNVSVTVTGAPGVLVLDSPSCDGAGNWTTSVDISAIDDGVDALSINAAQQDSAFNQGTATQQQADKDTVPPAPPLVTSQATSNVTPIISGSAETGSTVRVSVAGAVYSAMADASGNWNIDTANAPDSGVFAPDTNGVNQVVANSTDPAGNTSADDASSNELLIDTTPPPVPTVGAVTDDTGSIGNDNITNDTRPVIAGTWDNVAAVALSVTVNATTYVLGTDTELSVDGSGNWTLDLNGIATPLSEGVYDVIARAFDAVGNAGVDTSSNEFTIDLTPPPQPTVSALSTYILKPVITGQAVVVAGETVSVSVGGATYTVIPDGSNNWRVDTLNDTPDSGVLSLNTGGPSGSVNEVVVTVTDVVGNSISDSTTGELIISMDNDGDGMPDVAEGVGDSDGDGITNNFDLDSDNDGISDALESGASGNDADNDGIDDSYDVDQTGGFDFDGNGVDDNVLPLDSDGDSLPDYLDPDSDNDGIPDAVEGGQDRDGDGKLDSQDVDSDNDGVPDSVEAGLSGNDSDSDGIDDLFDVDVTGGVDANGDGIDDDAINLSGDLDGDGIADFADGDSDGDGVPDVLENGSSGSDGDVDGIDDAYDVDVTGGVDANADGIDDNVSPPDTDGDSRADFRDVDSDNDGIPDRLEAGVSGVDSDGDGIDNRFDVDATAGVDANSDGILDALPDTDNDGRADMRDPDADNDGLPDAYEAATTMLDSDGDGIDNRFDVDVTAGVDANNDGIDDNAIIDTDGDGLTNAQDVDSDADGIPDFLEGGATGIDTDNDGIDDRFDIDTTAGVDADGNGIDDAVSATDTDLDGRADYVDTDTDNDGIVDSVEADSGVDTDSDGIIDLYDVDSTAGIDSNNNGIDDASTVTDTDGDGIADFRDLDSDNDTVADVLEAGLVDADGDGLLDIGEATTTSPRDSMDPMGIDDGIADYRDGDSDGDGIDDIDAAGNAVLNNGSGQVTPATDNDRDGMADVVDGDPQMFGLGVDYDGDGVIDRLDLDDDNDGIPDMVEMDLSANDIDTDGDGIVNRLDRDSDNDGLPDSIEARTGVVLDSNKNGELDNFTDADNDGLHDTVSVSMIPVDTDSDSIPDYLDLDSDNDSLMDVYEAAGFSAVLDANNNGVLDNLVDSDRDGFADIVDTGVGSGAAGSALANPDTDGDGKANYRDRDSDNDGIGDELENSDVDGDGILDNLQVFNASISPAPPENTATGAGGGGGGSLSLWSCLIFGIAGLRRLRLRRRPVQGV